MIDRLLKLKIKGDGIIWMVFFFLCIISIIEVFSASSTLTFKSGSYFGPVLRHTGLLMIGVVFMVATMNIKCKYFKIVTPFALLLSLIMLIAVLAVGCTDFGRSTDLECHADRNGSRPTCFQIHLLAEFAVCPAHRHGESLNGHAPVYYPFHHDVCWTCSQKPTESYHWRRRIDGCLRTRCHHADGKQRSKSQGSRQQDGHDRASGDTGKERQPVQDCNSVERDFLSQAFSDFIYAIIIEEMGIWGAFFVCLLYVILLFRTATIANRCANAFPALLIMGIALLLVTQAFFNMMVAVGLAPVTGQPLPLISRGGTSTIMNCVYVGIILSVSYTAKKKVDANKKNEVRQALASA